MHNKAGSMSFDRGQALEISSDTASFCRTDISTLESGQAFCGNSRSPFFKISPHQLFSDLITQTTNITADIWTLFDSDRKTAKTDLLHPSETASCSQYLVVARFIIPSNIMQLDDYGQPFWAMLSSSISKCDPGRGDEKYTSAFCPLYIFKTKQMKLSASKLSEFSVGYRQSSAAEFDRYDELNSPPIPYPFTDQIKTTARVSTSMPSWLHLTSGYDHWHIVPLTNQDGILIECSHLTTFTDTIYKVHVTKDFEHIL
ncbi:hypothetical protein ACTXT7_014328 [Hymenolepis weldensis]